LLLGVAQIAHVESAIAVADVALDVVFWDQAAAAILTTVVIAVTFAATVPAIAPRLLVLALLADLVLGCALSIHQCIPPG
jgi:hypothetical protein